MKKWETLLILKNELDWIHSKGAKFFISEFATDVKDGTFKFIITTPSFMGLGMTTGMMSYVVDEKFVKKNFEVSSQTLKEYEEEYMKSYFEERD